MLLGYLWHKDKCYFLALVLFLSNLFLSHTHVPHFMSSSIHLYFPLVFLHEMIQPEKQIQRQKPFSASSPLICWFYLSLHPLFKLVVNFGVQPTFNCHLSSCQQTQSQDHHALKHTPTAMQCNAYYLTISFIILECTPVSTCTQTKIGIGKNIQQQKQFLRS